MRNEISQKRVREALSYDPETGVFRWKEKRRGRGKMGGIAGAPPKSNRPPRIMIDGVRYQAHRLAWIYVYGDAPEEIDHRNLDKKDNRISNLRPASRSQNEANKEKQPRNKSGYKGVSYNDTVSAYYARIVVNKKTINIGKHKDPKEAHEMYKQAAIKYFGEFARW